MFDMAVFAIALACFGLLAFVGGRMIASQDARDRVRSEADGAEGWLPGRRDLALLRSASDDIRVPR